MKKGEDGVVRLSDPERSDPLSPDHCVPTDRKFGGSVSLRRGGVQQPATHHDHQKGSLEV